MGSFVLLCFCFKALNLSSELFLKEAYIRITSLKRQYSQFRQIQLKCKLPHSSAPTWLSHFTNKKKLRMYRLN